MAIGSSVACTLLAGCGASSSHADIAPLHLAYAPGPIPTNESIAVHGLNTTWFTECNDLARLGVIGSYLTARDALFIG